MPLSVAVVALVCGIVCTSTMSKLDLAVETLVVTLLTHYFAVRSYGPKAEHIS
jgi:hypothetical protein